MKIGSKQFGPNKSSSKGMRLGKSIMKKRQSTAQLHIRHLTSYYVLHQIGATLEGDRIKESSSAGYQ